MNKIVLIGGSPTAGKSYTARKLAEYLKLPWISTDTIRDQMRQIVNKEDYPRLFDHSNADSKMAFDYLTKNTAKQIVKHSNLENADVWKGVKAIIKTDYVWSSFIVEGVAILPNLVHKLKDKRVTAVFLIDDDLERVRKTIFTRGLWDDPEKYSDSLKEKEVEWVNEFNKYILREAKKYNYPVIRIGDRKKYLEEVKRVIES